MAYQGFGYTIYIGDIYMFLLEPAFNQDRDYLKGMMTALRGDAAANHDNKRYSEGYSDGRKMFEYGGGAKAKARDKAYYTRRAFKLKAAVDGLLKRGPKVCAKCGTDRDITVDHIHPVSKGGGNEIENLQFLCWPCNRRKGNR